MYTLRSSLAITYLIAASIAITFSNTSPANMPGTLNEPSIEETPNTAYTAEIIQQKFDYNHQLLLDELRNIPPSKPQQLVKKKLNSYIEKFIMPDVNLQPTASSIIGKYKIEQDREKYLLKLLTIDFIKAYSYLLLHNTNRDELNIEFVSLRQQSLDKILLNYKIQKQGTNKSFEFCYILDKMPNNTWQITNIKIANINLMLAWLNKTNRLMSRHNDISKVIDLWHYSDANIL